MKRNTLISSMKNLAVLSTLLASPAMADECVDFESLSSPGPYSCCGELFRSNGVRIRTKEFFWSSGTSTSDGTAEIRAEADGGPGDEIAPNNINLSFDISDFLGTPGVQELRFQYYYTGGNTNLKVNGKLANYDTFSSIPSAFFNSVGVSITVVATPDGYNEWGEVILVADADHCIRHLTVGGQELRLDDFCASGPCGDCPEDVDEDGVVGFSDLLLVLDGWGPCPDCPEDIDGDADVGFSDLLAILDAWGDCDPVPPPE